VTFGFGHDRILRHCGINRTGGGAPPSAGEIWEDGSSARVKSGPRDGIWDGVQARKERKGDGIMDRINDAFEI